ncbi:preprotein translocase subunit SecG [Buchnera aphidicola]|uniref:preprotein translocase subunit SecG n=1 Tax=Buchnera aphidicola TaxID=9 RepID=UPI0031B6B8D9
MFSFFTSFFFFIALFLIFLILIQPTEGSESIANIWEVSHPILSKFVSENTIKKITFILAILFFVLCLMLCNLNFLI